MNLLKAGVLLPLALYLFACGTQVVEFGLDSGAKQDAALTDGSVVDAAKSDAATRDGAQLDGSIADASDGSFLDSGVDAGSTDAGATDAEGLDARADAGATDAEGLDARADASDGDAGATDAVSRDATADAGGLDASGTDATDLDGGVNERPRVIAVTPPNLSANVSINVAPTAEFSEAMDPLTINALTFTVRQGLMSIAGLVTFDEATRTATFTPALPLALNATYVATISTGATDLSGLGLASDYVWSFTTGVCSLATIDLRSADDFVVLAGSTVTNAGPTSITGDLGVSPGTAITGFPPGTVVGSQHAGDPTSAQASADLTTAYNDAAGRTLCPVAVAGNLGGQTLTPGLYRSTSSLAISSGDLTLDAQGDTSAVFIFQAPSTLTTTSGRQVLLINGARAANVFWQVGTSATLGTTTVFRGTIMADQSITLNTGATVNGRLLARIGAVNLDGNTIVTPGL